jgi:hypothetical protein
MGAWGAGSFENDTALDWRDQLVDSGTIQFLRETLLSVVETSDEYLEVDEAYNAVAAAEVVAALKGQPSPDLPPEVTQWVSKHSTKQIDPLLRLAQLAVQRVKTDSEPKELWEESPGTGDEWHAVIQNLEERLAK